MTDWEKLKSILPNGESLTDEDFERLLIGDCILIIEWNEDGSIKDNWGILE